MEKVNLSVADQTRNKLTQVNARNLVSNACHRENAFQHLIPAFLDEFPIGSTGRESAGSRVRAPLAPPVVSTTPPHPEVSPDRPGAVTVSRIVARNSGHPEPYTGTRTVLVCSSRPRGSAAAAGGGTAPRTSPLRWRGPQGTRNDPDNFGSAAGGFTQALGGVGRLQTRTRRVSRVQS